MSNINISLLTQEHEEKFKVFCEENENVLFYHSFEYREFLKKILKNSEDTYLLALDGSKIVGILPLFTHRLSNGLSVINSLPFFGSHGGLIIDKKANSPPIIAEILLKELLAFSKKERCISLNIVDNPFYSMSCFYEKWMEVLPTDQRVSQVTFLPMENTPTLEEDLMLKFHSKTRNVVRKSLKMGFSVEINNNVEAFHLIHDLHVENMRCIGGKEKPKIMFEIVPQIFTAEKDYNLYLAFKEKDLAAGLLIFYNKDYCEYFTPVINDKYRSGQPLSLLIFKAMKDACARGIRFWNWGGTWVTNQDSVYFFKKRWGARESTYNYYTKVFDWKSLVENRETILKEAPYFYLQNFKIKHD